MNHIKGPSESDGHRARSGCAEEEDIAVVKEESRETGRAEEGKAKDGFIRFAEGVQQEQDVRLRVMLRPIFAFISKRKADG